VDNNVLNNFQKLLEEVLSETKKTIFVSSFNCETRPVRLISDTLDSGATFIMLDAFDRMSKHVKPSVTKHL